MTLVFHVWLLLLCSSTLSVLFGKVLLIGWAAIFKGINRWRIWHLVGNLHWFVSAKGIGIWTLDRLGERDELAFRAQTLASLKLSQSNSFTLWVLRFWRHQPSSKEHLFVVVDSCNVSSMLTLCRINSKRILILFQFSFHLYSLVDIPLCIYLQLI